MTTRAMPKPHGNRGMEGLVAKWYAANTAEMMKEYVDLAQRVSKQVPQGNAVLEIAPGPGYFCIELAKLGSYEITGVDISRTFVKMAREKAAAKGVKADFKQGSASNLLLQSNYFDFLLCRAAFKNFAEPVVALQEMFRVLKPGGRGLIGDLRRDASPDMISQHVDGMGLSRINRFLTKGAFKLMLLKSAYTRQEFEYMLAQTKFSKVNIVEDAIGLEIWMTK